MTETSSTPIRPRMFTKRNSVLKLSSDSLKRQSLITHLACSLLGDPVKAIKFLNQENQSLGGRPLAIATATSAGFLAVENAVRLLAGPYTGPPQ